MGIVARCQRLDPGLADLLKELAERIREDRVAGWHVRETVRNLIIVRDLQTTLTVERQGDTLLLRAA